MEFFHQYHSETQIIHNQKISFAPHLHNEIEIITLFKGSATLTADGETYMINTGDFVFILPNTVHSYTLENDVDVGKFIFSPDSLPEVENLIKDKRLKFPVIAAEKVRGLDLLAKEILENYKSSSATVKKAYLLLLTGKLLEVSEAELRSDLDNDVIIKILGYCRENFRSDINLTDIADALYISKSYVSHIFSCKLKINFRDYINSLRVGEAARLLLQGEVSVTEAAAQSGFNSLRTFNRAFFKHMDMTPKDYKKRSDKA